MGEQGKQGGPARAKENTLRKKGFLPRLPQQAFDFG
ncbi:MAG: hypothetical protein DVB28_001097 [Verrucomicrobia bacterium]|nr:MAG: hypothetical protein DVB28_001097 [Verrucomicrobiota bacterium]